MNGCHKWCLAPVGYLSLKVRKLIVPHIDLSLSEEQPSLDGLKMLLVFCAPKPVSVEVHVNLWGRTRALSSGVLPGPLRGELSRGHLLQRHICKVSLQGNTILKQNQAKMAYDSF